MEASNLSWAEPVADEALAVADGKPAAVLRGTARGLEVVIDAAADSDAIDAAIVKWLDKAPGFFKGSDVRVRVEDGPLASGGLGRIDAIAQRFDLRIVEVSAAKVVIPLGIVEGPNLATGSAPMTPAEAIEVAEAVAEFDDVPTNASAPNLVPVGPITVEQLVAPHLVAEDEPTQTGAAPLQLAASSEIALATESSDSSATRVVVGPVRSGVILDHKGHLIVFGDVNPGAEVRAAGNIVVLGRLRGTAHAGIGQELGFILALRLEPQQLRIGRRVARSGDDAHAVEPEIAYATNDTIVVERYQGKLPRNLASSI